MPIRVDWTGATTLKQTVFKLFEARKTDSSEFKAILSFYGHKRMAELYEEWLAGKKKEKENF